MLYFKKSEEVRNRQVSAQVARSEYRVRPSLSEWSLRFLSREYRGSTFFNGDVVGIHSWDLNGGASSTGALLRHCGYFDFVSTNLLAQFDVEDGTRVLLEGRRLFINRFGQIRSFEDSWLANVIGISTLAFTRDGKLLVVQQTSSNVGSPNLRAPSGSGALEKRDLPEMGQESFQAILCRGASRELAEECQLDESEIESTSIVAFGRWLHRGAMPEFSAVSLLSVDSHEVVGRGIRPSERAYVQSVKAIRLASLNGWSADRPASVLPATERKAPSFPLVLALSGLVDAVNDPGWRYGSDLRDRLTR